MCLCVEQYGQKIIEKSLGVEHKLLLEDIARWSEKIEMIGVDIKGIEEDIEHQSIQIKNEIDEYRFYK
jgi:hypothetical protein